ncbi:MAG: polysaccharide pyruvyl transferase family protein [Planctomycetaceae bacterium]|nr:polysaccharide pyruvyl transferase family protein [Planctomycetaceae bacterium]
MVDSWMMDWMSRTIERARLDSLSGGREDHQPGEQLKLLFAGYNGAYNMGADVRVEEMIRQVSHLLGPDRLDASVFRYEDPRVNYYFGDARKLQPQVLFPRYLNRIVPEHDGVIACEGSTFKSKFTDLLSALMVGAMGLASANDRLSVAYGAEAGDMTPELTEMVTKYCRDSYIITRNQESSDRLKLLGLDSDTGTDTAWSFEPLPREYGEWELRKQGWRGEPLLMVCPINPFWWPVQIHLRKSIARIFGMYRNSHYARVFFFQNHREVEEKFDRYLRALAGAVSAFCKKRGYFPVVGASERLDQFAMRRLSSLLGGTPTFLSSEYDVCQFVSILRCADLMVSSRYHAVVTSMPGGVASAGVSMDERLDNLMHDRGHRHLLMNVAQPDLEERLFTVLENLRQDREQIQDEISATVVRHLGMMSEMGSRLLGHIGDRYPEFADQKPNRSWEGYLPPLSEQLHRQIEIHEDVVTPAAA